MFERMTYYLLIIKSTQKTDNWGQLKFSLYSFVAIVMRRQGVHPSWTTMWSLQPLWTEVPLLCASPELGEIHQTKTVSDRECERQELCVQTL